MFESVSLDGFFTGREGDMSWAHANDNDTEWNDFVSGNASGGSVLLFGRVTYEMMASFWPTPMASQRMPAVARKMNEGEKVVFSRTLGSVSWMNTRLVNGDPASEVRHMKSGTGPDMVILGSGSIVAQLAREELIDEYQLVVAPVMLGAGRSLFDGIGEARRGDCGARKRASSPTETWCRITNRWGDRPRNTASNC
jgi:dihydrofolate reductase